MTEKTSIPGYTLLQSIGRGNTSLVYLARDAAGQQVALKVPHPATLKVQEAAERFGNEVRLTMKLRHPHIVHGYAGTPFGPQAFLALRYYPQGALNEQLFTLPDQILPLEDALRVLADVAAALTYIHQQGAVHQDVKTQNVYVQGGRAALGDLGSAYFTAQGGKVSGSPYYMAPEIFHGEGSSGASDVYSLGILMYELLTGQRPHRGNTYEELMVAHMTRLPPPLLHLNSRVDRQVSRLAGLALAQRPSERPSADLLRRALRRSLGEPADDVTPEEPATAPAVPVLKGRHGHGPAERQAMRQEKEESPEAARPPSKVGGWNPFKRRK